VEGETSDKDTHESHPLSLALPTSLRAPRGVLTILSHKPRKTYRLLMVGFVRTFYSQRARWPARIEAQLDVEIILCLRAKKKCFQCLGKDNRLPEACPAGVPHKPHVRHVPVPTRAMFRGCGLLTINTDLNGLSSTRNKGTEVSRRGHSLIRERGRVRRLHVCHQNSSGWRTTTNALSKPRNINGNFGTSDLSRLTYPYSMKQKKKQISDDQLKVTGRHTGKYWRRVYFDA